MTRLSCWHLHQQGQRAFPTTSFSTGAGHDVVGDHVWEHLQFKQWRLGGANGQRDQTQIEGWCSRTMLLCVYVLGIFAGNSLDEKNHQENCGRAKMFVPKREKDAVCYAHLRWNRCHFCRLRSWGPINQTSESQIEMTPKQWHQQNIQNKFKRNWISNVQSHPSSQFMKLVEDVETHLQAALWKGNEFFQSLSIPKGLLTNDRLHTIPIHLTLLFLPPNGRAPINHHWDYCSKEFNLKCLTFKRHLLLRHGAEDLQCLQKGKCKGRMLSLNS